MIHNLTPAEQAEIKQWIKEAVESAVAKIQQVVFIPETKPSKSSSKETSK